MITPEEKQVPIAFKKRQSGEKTDILIVVVDDDERIRHPACVILKIP